jgi:formylglycine-generating enzyme required for sulfatase activity
VSYYDIRENPDNSAISPNWPASAQVHADSFMGKLRAKTGYPGFDLPTESQWEYACRAGTATALNSGYKLTNTGKDPRMDEVGRYWENGGSGTSQNCAPSAGMALVGSYLPNAWGLYDMHGNVWEWCLDWYGTYPGTATDPKGASSYTHRIVRGGSFDRFASTCRSAYRTFDYPDDRINFHGFRVALAPPDQQ